MNIKVLYEDENYLVINKPSGLMVHPDGVTKKHTVTDWLVKKYPYLKGVGEPLASPTGVVIDKPGIVHRIDKETSGILVIAKNQFAYEALKKQFQNHRVKKIYHAFVYGKFKDAEGRIDRPIGRDKKDFRKRSTARGMRGDRREAVTYYRVIGETDTVSFIEIRPETGRTHQIRVHLSSIGRPIICDTLYAPKEEPKLGFKRLALHASRIQFKNVDGGLVSVEAPFPPDFLKARHKFNI